MDPASDHCGMELILLLFFVALGPLALLYGADSRLDERRRR